jgi:hypothetical protein
MKSHRASKSPATGPVTGHSSEVSTPTSVDPAKVHETGADRHGFPNRKAIVDKALEGFLSFRLKKFSGRLMNKKQKAGSSPWTLLPSAFLFFRDRAYLFGA